MKKQISKKLEIIHQNFYYLYKSYLEINFFWSEAFLTSATFLLLLFYET